MAITPRTAEEASKYILESVEDWKRTGQDKKIISLSNMAEKWRSSVNTGPITKMREILKSLRDMERTIKRNEKIDIPSGIMHDQWESLKAEYKVLVEKYGEPKPKVKKANIKIEPEVK